MRAFGIKHRKNETHVCSLRGTKSVLRELRVKVVYIPGKIRPVDRGINKHPFAIFK